MPFNTREFVAKAPLRPDPRRDATDPPPPPSRSGDTMRSPESMRVVWRTWADRHVKGLAALAALMATVGFFVNMGWLVAEKQSGFAKAADTRAENAMLRSELHDATLRVEQLEKHDAVKEQSIADIRETLHEIRDSLKGFNRSPANRGKPTPFPQIEER